MTDERLSETVSDVVAARVRALRKARNWLTGDVAARCAELGVPELTENVIENIESGRRRNGRRTRAVTVDELYTLAEALDAPPVALLPDGLKELPGYMGGQVREEDLSESIAILQSAQQLLRFQRGKEG